MRKHPNIAKDILLTKPEQLWVTDTTYIKTEEGNCYANMVTDAFTRKIVGYAIADNMETESMIKAYQMALKEQINKTLPTIHHSDRGLQYCSHDYIKLTQENKGLTSMTENGDRNENALAKRMNRTIKDEFGLGERLKTKQQAYQLMKEAVYLYNNIRPHLALKYKTPNSAHEKIPKEFIIPQGSNTYF